MVSNLILNHCLITGGPRGIGRATALLAARSGYDISIVGITKASVHAKSLADEIVALGRRAVILQGDMSNEDDISLVFDQAVKSLGPLTGLVNAAGVGYTSRVSEFDGSELTRLMAVNVIGLMLCCREATRRMSTAKGGQGGAIVNISSMAATIGGRPLASAYAASKGAVDVFSTGFAREVASQGIRVNVVRPGVISTDMTAKIVGNPELLAKVEASIPMGRVGTADEIANSVVWLLSKQASLITGAHLNAGGGGFNVAGFHGN